VLDLAGFSSIHLTLPLWHLPLGISFFTFSAISYLIDIYRGEVKFDRNPMNTALYISFFPKLLAGPIVQYRHMAEQIADRTITMDKAAGGIQSFVIGLGKKVLIANTLGTVADQIFAIPSNDLTTSLSWLGIVCYTLQIYFDFSGYSDMAIGIGRMAGFDFLENFNYPYISQSIREFWRRWHISLSTWFRDYLYIPLGGNRHKPARTYLNLMIVFFLCGLWHGAGWTFVVWGVWHGIFMSVEHTRFGDIIKRTWSPVRHVYALVVVMIGWVLFRSETFSYAVVYLKAMFGFASGNGLEYFAGMYVSRLVLFVLLVALIGAVPLFPTLTRLKDEIVQASQAKGRIITDIVALSSPLVTLVFLGSVFVASAMSLSGASNNPFIYFRF